MNLVLVLNKYSTQSEAVATVAHSLRRVVENSTIWHWDGGRRSTQEGISVGGRPCPAMAGLGSNTGAEVTAGVPVGLLEGAPMTTMI